jgi:multisubunit Na+/H+ antiporter MnhB subunit
MYTQKISKLVILVFAIMLLFTFSIALVGAKAPGGDPDGGLTTGGDPDGGLTPGGDPEDGNIDNESAGGLMNPLKADSLVDLLLAIIDILLVFALPIVILYIMYGGYLLVTAQGESGQIENGRNAILWAVVGGVIIFAAHLIIKVIQGTVTSLSI